MWKYLQSTGDLFHDSTFVERGYSGAGHGRNNPELECKKDVGPIPRGYYTIGKERSSPTAVTLPLKPDDPDHCSPRRTGFLIHGDRETGNASTGCIVLNKRAREKIRDSADDRLRVVANSQLKRRGRGHHK